MPPRKGKQAVRNSGGGFPGWGWAIVGLAGGALLMAALMHKSLLPMTPTGPQPNPQATAARGSDTGLEPAAASTARKKPQYDFYSVLPEREVRIPDDQISAMAREEQQRQKQPTAKPAPANSAAAPLPPGAPHATVTQNVVAAPASTTPQASAPGSGYLLQIGAFPSAAEAEALKAKLAFQGFVANVQPVTIGGQTFQRVRLGPFHSATELQAAQQRLTGASIKAIALKEGKSPEPTAWPSAAPPTGGSAP